MTGAISCRTEEILPLQSPHKPELCTWGPAWVICHRKAWSPAWVICHLGHLFDDLKTLYYLLTHAQLHATSALEEIIFL